MSDRKRERERERLWFSSSLPSFLVWQSHYTRIFIDMWCAYMHIGFVCGAYYIACARIESERLSIPPRRWPSTHTHTYSDHCIDASKCSTRIELHDLNFAKKKETKNTHTHTPIVQFNNLWQCVVLLYSFESNIAYCYYYALFSLLLPLSFSRCCGCVDVCCA